MNAARLAIRLLSTVIVALSVSYLVRAQTRTFVSSTGSDANVGCPRSAPCRNYQAAINAVAPGGEVVPLDSAGYGTIVITGKSVSIAVPPGIYAGVSVSTGNAVTISGLSANDVVTLSGLVINGNNAAANGISMSGSGKLNVINCTFTRFVSRGIFVTGGEVNLEDSQIIGNTVGVRGEGQGPDQDSSIGGITPRVTVVRISHGVISDNSTAFEMHNAGIAGTRPMGGCNAMNIFLRDTGGQANIVGNPTFLAVTGTSDFNAGCGGSVVIGTYGSQAQNGTTVANQ